MHITALIWITVLFISGCATTPPFPKIDSIQGDRIGIIVDIANSPTHTHVGTTIFNNFSKNYPYNLNLSSKVYEIIKRSAQSAGFIAVDLRAEGIHYSEVADLIRPAGETWQLTQGKESTLNRLHEELNLKALFVLKDSRVMTALECAGGPCSERYADGSGLYTRSIFGFTNYFAVAAFQWNVFVLDPLADAALVNPLAPILRMPVTHLPNFKDPADFKNLSEIEFSVAAEAILKFTEKASNEAIKILTTN